MEAQDNLLCTKILQASQVNKSHILTFPFSIEGYVYSYIDSTKYYIFSLFRHGLQLESTWNPQE